jgi:Cu-Zn family superoxide dismutase
MASFEAMRRNRITLLAAAGMAGALLAACGEDTPTGSAAQNTTSTAVTSTTVRTGAAADLMGADGQPKGRVTFVETGGRLVVEGKLTGLPPGFHGFHVHAVGKCEAGPPAFTSAGGHLVVGDQAHPVHAGDGPVIMVLADQTAEIRFTTDRYKLAELLSAEGTAMMVHANPDNYSNVPTRYAPEVDAMTKATGDAGDRIACGVVKRS